MGVVQCSLVQVVSGRPRAILVIHDFEANLGTDPVDFGEVVGPTPKIYVSTAMSSSQAAARECPAVLEGWCLRPRSLCTSILLASLLLLVRHLSPLAMHLFLVAYCLY